MQEAWKIKVKVAGHPIITGISYERQPLVFFWKGVRWKEPGRNSEVNTGKKSNKILIII